MGDAQVQRGQPKFGIFPNEFERDLATQDLQSRDGIAECGAHISTKRGQKLIHCEVTPLRGLEAHQKVLPFAHPILVPFGLGLWLWTQQVLGVSVQGLLDLKSTCVCS